MAITRIDYVDDAEVGVSPSMFLEAPPSAPEDWESAPPWFDESGWVLPAGGFLLRTDGRVFLIDAGLGPNVPDPGGEISDPVGVAHAGRLLASLKKLGVSPDEVTDVVLTHLHADHGGWIAPSGTPVFGHARHHCHRADFDRLTPATTNPSMAGVHDQIAAVSDLLIVAEEDRTPIADSIALRLFAGHSPGNCIVEVETTDSPVLLLGDTVHHPLLLVENKWTDRLDEDGTEAARSRERVAAELERTGAVGIGAHFPGLRGGRLIRNRDGKREWRLA